MWQTARGTDVELGALNQRFMINARTAEKEKKS